MELKSWKASDLDRLVKLNAGQRMEAACILLQNAIKQDLVARDNKELDNPSEPGEPPAKVTGRLSGSISRELNADKTEGRVGTNVKYGKHLEIGTSKMAKRPFLRKNFDEHWAKIKAILQGGM